MASELRLTFALLILNFTFSSATAAPTVDRIESAKLRLYQMGVELAKNADDPETAKPLLKQAIKTIQRTRTPLGRMENWMEKHKSFQTMMIEGFTVAGAIAMGEVFLHSADGVSAREVVLTLLSTAGLITGVYVPLRTAIDKSENAKNAVLLASFFDGIRSVVANFPFEPEGQIEWLENSVGSTKWVNACETLLLHK